MISGRPACDRGDGHEAIRDEDSRLDLIPCATQRSPAGRQHVALFRVSSSTPLRRNLGFGR